MGWSRAHYGKNSGFEIRGGEGVVMWDTSIDLPFSVVWLLLGMRCKTIEGFSMKLARSLARSSMI